MTRIRRQLKQQRVPTAAGHIIRYAAATHFQLRFSLHRDRLAEDQRDLPAFHPQLLNHWAGPVFRIPFAIERPRRSDLLWLWRTGR